MYRLAAVEFPRDRFPVGGYWYSMVFCVRFQVRYMWVKVFLVVLRDFVEERNRVPADIHTCLPTYVHVPRLMTLNKTCGEMIRYLYLTLPSHQAGEVYTAD